MSDERERALDRIQKCLRLAESGQAHEAAAALRQAQKLMEKFSISEQEARGYTVEEKVVITKEAFGGCAYLAQLTALIAKAFGVEAFWEPGNGISRVRANIRYIGPSGVVSVATYAHRVIDRCIRTEWDRACWENPTLRQKPGSRQSFRLAFLHAVDKQVYAVAPSPEYAKVVKAHIASRYQVTVVDKSKKPVEFDDEAVMAGLEAGAEFKLHRPMGQEESTNDQKAIGHEQAP